MYVVGCIQCIGALLETVPAEHKHALMLDFTGEQPQDLIIRRSCAFPKQSVIFRAYADYDGKPWFDYCWLRVNASQGGSEIDPMVPLEKRQLGQVFGFTKWKGKAYVFVELYQRVYNEPGIRKHPILRKYKYWLVRRGGAVVHPVYAFDVKHIIATAVVFPDPDFTPLSSGLEKEVLYIPSIAEMMLSSSGLPGEANMPRVPDRVVHALNLMMGTEKEVEDSDQEEVTEGL